MLYCPFAEALPFVDLCLCDDPSAWKDEKDREKKIWKRQEKKEDVEREFSKFIIDATRNIRVETYLEIESVR